MIQIAASSNPMVVDRNRRDEDETSKRDSAGGQAKPTNGLEKKLSFHSLPLPPPDPISADGHLLRPLSFSPPMLPSLSPQNSPTPSTRPARAASGERVSESIRIVRFFPPLRINARSLRISGPKHGPITRMVPFRRSP